MYVVCDRVMSVVWPCICLLAVNWSCFLIELTLYCLPSGSVVCSLVLLSVASSAVCSLIIVLSIGYAYVVYGCVLFACGLVLAS